MISILDEVAAPEIAEPTSNSRKRAMNVHYIDQRQKSQFKDVAYLQGEIGI
jgi:hypothetical protein